MLKLKLVQTVPDNAANMAFIRSDVLNPTKNVSMIDYSPDIPSDFGRVAKDRVSYCSFVWGSNIFAPTLLSEAAVVFSNRSVMHPDIVEPKALYYKHVLGAGPRQASARQYVMLCDSAPFTVNTSRLELRKALKIYDDGGRQVTDISWDLEVESIYVEGTENIGFNVVVWTDKPNFAGRSYFIKYKAYNVSTGETLPNHLEILNTSPVDLGEFDVRLMRQPGSAGWMLTSLGTPTAADHTAFAPGLVIFPPSDPDQTGTLTIPAGWPAGNITLEGPGGAPVYVITNTVNMSLRDMAAEINKYPYMRAAALGTSEQLYWGLPFFPIVYTPIIDGTVLYQTGSPANACVVHWKHRIERRIRPLPPVHNTPYHSWYPRVTKGEFVDFVRWESGGLEYQTEVIYSIPEICNRQDYSPAHGPGIREALDELVTISGPRSVQTANFPIHNFDSIVLSRSDKEVIYPYDADLANGKVYFDTDLTNSSDLLISYAYEAPYQYQGIDLNPTPLHNPDILGKFVGVYMVPQQVRVSRGTTTGITWAGDHTTVIDLCNYRYSVEGDTNLTLLDISGLCLCSNTDNQCKLYITSSITDDYFRVYKDSARTELVAEYTWTVDPVSGGHLLVTPMNDSGLTVLIELGGDLSDTEYTVHIHDQRQVVRHIIGSSVQEIQDALDAMEPLVLETGYQLSLPKLLAIYQVTLTSSAEDVTMLDTRTRGGGLREDIDPAGLEEARMYWDIGNFEGEPFQSAGAVVINMPTGVIPGTGIPDSVLPCNVDPSGWMSANNHLTYEQIDDKIRRHIALGIYPLLDYDESE